jgi:hypothetical protein
VRTLALEEARRIRRRRKRARVSICKGVRIQFYSAGDDPTWALYVYNDEDSEWIGFEPTLEQRFRASIHIVRRLCSRDGLVQSGYWPLGHYFCLEAIEPDGPEFNAILAAERLA